MNSRFVAEAGMAGQPLPKSGDSPTTSTLHRPESLFNFAKYQSFHDLKEFNFCMNMASASQRLSSIVGHLNPLDSQSGRGHLLQKNLDDVVSMGTGCPKNTAIANQPGHHVGRKNSSDESEERRSQGYPA